MSAERDVTPIVRTWLQDGVTSLPDHVLDRVLDQVPAIRQERGRIGRAGGTNQCRTHLKLALAAAAVIVVAVAGLSLVPRTAPGSADPCRRRRIGTRPSPLSPTRTERSCRLDARETAVRHLQRWHMCCRMVGVRSDISPDDPGSRLSAGRRHPPTRHVRLLLRFRTTTYPDPCNEVPVDPPVGPTVDDLVQALREIPNISTTEPVASTLRRTPGHISRDDH